MISGNTFSQEELAQIWLRCCSSTIHDLGQHPAWSNNWLRTYKKAKDVDLVLVSEDTTQVYPLMLHQKHGMRRLTWLGQGTGMPTDYVGPLAAKLDRSDVHCLLDHLYLVRDRWDYAELAIAPWQAEANALINGTLTYGHHPIWRDFAYVGNQVAIELPSTYDLWVESLGRRTRSDVRKYRKKMAACGAEIDLLWGSASEEALSELFELNCRKWTVFANETDKSFLRNVCRSTWPVQDGLFLATLTFSGATRAAVLGYKCGTSCFLHTAGIGDGGDTGIAPGIALYAALFDELLNLGVTYVDLSPGAEEYKFRLGGKWSPLVAMRFSFSKPMFYAAKGLGVLGSFASKVRERVRNRSNSPT
jgi:CelD/BcsL family acetyltransferase involved in cellulose biosynthesis